MPDVVELSLTLGEQRGHELSVLSLSRRRRSLNHNASSVRTNLQLIERDGVLNLFCARFIFSI